MPISVRSRDLLSDAQRESDGRSDPPEPSAPQDAAPGQVLLEIAVRDEQERSEVESLLSAVLPLIREHNDRVYDVIDAILPRDAVLSAGAVAQSRRNAILRDEIARRYGLFGASDVATIAGSKAANPSATATRWRQANKIFAVNVGTALLYPGFQFTGDGTPVSQVGAVLEVLGDHLRGWELAAWMTEPVEILGGRAPVEVWEDDLDVVLNAAQAEVDRLRD